MEMVTVYDFDTETSREIPAAELAPGMVRAEVQGVGLVWIDASKTKLGHFQHPPFDPALREIINAQIRIPLQEVLPKSMDDLEDGFRRDHNAEHEIALWCHLASRFTSFVESEFFDRQQKQECFNVMLACTLGPPEQVFEIVTLKVLTREQAERAINAFIQPGGK